LRLFVHWTSASCGVRYGDGSVTLLCHKLGFLGDEIRIFVTLVSVIFPRASFVSGFVQKHGRALRQLAVFSDLVDAYLALDRVADEGDALPARFVVFISLINAPELVKNLVQGHSRTSALLLTMTEHAI
jgi:hypothetical protein